MQITFTVSHETGEVSSHIEGIKGKKCGPISDAIKQDMLSLGAEVSQSNDTPEMLESETVTQTVRLQVRS